MDGARATPLTLYLFLSLSLLRILRRRNLSLPLRGTGPPGPWWGHGAAGVVVQMIVGPGPDSIIALSLRAYVGGPPPGPNELAPLQYWPFSSADLYSWKTNHPSFSENPSGLTGLLESLMFSHQPTWDDCQQLLQVLFTTEERERILLEARKNVLGPDRTPTNLPTLVDPAFPLARPDWNFNTAEGREHLTVYRQTLVAGLKGGRTETHQFGQGKRGSSGSSGAALRFLRAANGGL